ncbi:hypothetical protein A4244_19180 [Bacillus badius]|nr:hypothetical protein A4244_19180 [Bacillus badius]KZR59152.1 hypothetical protein A3781_14285 [Bacillus badius]OCS84354.1 hypothetical protein A6M11_19195 [Bacillus badius]OVE46598.1 hypothetical protein B1A98_19355 [Bacillus badius]
MQPSGWLNGLKPCEINNLKIMYREEWKNKINPLSGKGFIRAGAPFFWYYSYSPQMNGDSKKLF